MTLNKSYFEVSTGGFLNQSLPYKILINVVSLRTIINYCFKYHKNMINQPIINIILCLCVIHALKLGPQSTDQFTFFAYISVRGCTLISKFGMVVVLAVILPHAKQKFMTIPRFTHIQHSS